MKKPKIVWDDLAKQELKAIYNYYKPISTKVADAILDNIAIGIEKIRFTHQYQKDVIQPEYRRLIVSHYKVIYMVDAIKITILSIFDTRQDPNKQHL